MKYESFVRCVAAYPVFGAEVLDTVSGSKAVKHLQLSRWVKTGKVLRLKRGLYTLPEEQLKIRFSSQWLANTLYSPSYLSLEYALSWYDMLPERVHVITSVSRLKTAKFTNPIGTFIYHSIKQELFFGFEEILDAFQKPVLMATREKAVLDYIYFCDDWESNEKFLEENIRFQQLETLKPKRLKEFARKFGSKKILNAVDILLSRR